MAAQKRKKKILQIFFAFLNKKNKKAFMVTFYGWGSTGSRLEPLQGAVYFAPLSSQMFLVLILSTSEGWKTVLTLKSPSGFEHKTPGLEIQHLNH